MRQNIFMTVALLIGLGLIVLSFYLTPLVEKNSTDRAKQATRGVQILGVAIFCISATKLTCQGSHSNFNILLGIMLLLGGVCTGLFSIIHNDCVDARTFTPYALGVSVCIMIGSLIGILIAIIVHYRKTKTKIKEAAKPRYGVYPEQLAKLALNQEDEFKLKNQESDDDESNIASETTTPDSKQSDDESNEQFFDAHKNIYHDATEKIKKTKKELFHELLDDSEEQWRVEAERLRAKADQTASVNKALRLRQQAQELSSEAERLKAQKLSSDVDFDRFPRNAEKRAKYSKMQPREPSSLKDSPKATLSTDHPLKSIIR